MNQKSKKSSLLTLIVMVMFQGSFAQITYESSIITPPNYDSALYFGGSVAMDGKYLVVGATGDSYDVNEQNFVLGSGALNVFEKQSNGEYLFKQKLTANDRSISKGLGVYTAISGNSIVTLALDDIVYNGQTVNDAGAVYFFNLESGVWKFNARFQQFDADSLQNNYGRTMSIDGNYAIIGAPSASLDENGMNRLNGPGAGYIYKKDGNGNWSFHQKIVVSNRGNYFRCGDNLDIQGNTLAMGCPGNKTDENGIPINGTGGVYIFTKNSNDVWVEGQKLTQPYTNTGGGFTNQLRFSNNLLFIGDAGNTLDVDQKNEIIGAGAVWVYKLNNTRYEKLQKLVSNDRMHNDRFGEAFDVHDDLAVICAPFRNWGNGMLAGTSYIFYKNSSENWVQVSHIEPKDKSEYGVYGREYETAIQDRVICLGAELYPVNNIKGGGGVFRFDPPSYLNVPPLENQNISNSLRVFPIPANQFLNVEFMDKEDKISFLKITDLQGRIVYQNTDIVESYSTIDISSLLNGYYLLSATTESGRLLTNSLIISKE